MGKAKQISLVFLGVLGLLVIALGVVIATFDVNAYRADIANVLSKQFNRTVQLKGPVKFRFSSTGGLAVIVHDAAIANPVWASRAQMAGIGKLELGVELFPLFHHQLKISQVTVGNADILLETSGTNQHNWDLQMVDNNQPTNVTPAKTPAVDLTNSSASPSAAISVDKINISNSQLALRTASGDINTFIVKSGWLEERSDGLTLHFDSLYNGSPLLLDLKSSAGNLQKDTTWPFEATASYAGYDVKAKGEVSQSGKLITFRDYAVSFGGSNIHGQIQVALDGVRPSISGVLLSDKLSPSDIKPFPVAGVKETNSALPASVSATIGASPVVAAPTKLFGDEALPLAALKSADIQLDIKIDEMDLTHIALNHIAATMTLSQGRLALSPLTAKLADSEINMQFVLDASLQPAQMSLSLKAPTLDLTSLLKAAGTKEFMAGKGNIDVSLTANGNSPEALASTTNGAIALIVDSGSISVQALGQVGAGLAELIAPGSSTSQMGLNCLVVRFDVKDGIAHDNGLLGDTTATTVAGTGGFNLGAETLDIMLHGRPKIANALGILPPVHIGGTMIKPHITLDKAGTIQSVMGLLSNSKADTSGVPVIMTEAGQNSCLYTLSHPSAAGAKSQPPVQDVSTKTTNKAQKVGNILKGLLGH